MAPKLKKTNGLQWLTEPLERHPTYYQRKMFGCEAVYLDGLLSLVLADSGEEPWNGAMFPTDRSHHSSVLKDFPTLVSHPILGKWLYISQDHRDFERVATAVIDRIRLRDERFGVESTRKKKGAGLRGKTKRSRRTRLKAKSSST